MTEVEAIETMLAQWEDGFDDLHAQESTDPGYVPYTYKNEDFTPDVLGQLGAWARVTVIHTSAKQMTQGRTRKYERRGTITVTFFGPLNAGEGWGSDLCDDARSVLEGRRLGGVNLYAATPVPQLEGGQWAKAAIVIPFRYTETRTID